MSLKHLGQLASPRNWSGMVWTALVMVLLCAIGTAIVGVKLYEVTGRQAQFNPR